MVKTENAIETFSGDERQFEPSAAFRKTARISSREQYEKLYRESLDDPNTFWTRETQDLVFRSRWKTLCKWEAPHAEWFVEATLNATESCLDRHLKTSTRDKTALIWEGENGDTRHLTYAELHAKVVAFAAALRRIGVKKGDRVAIYMGMVPEVVVGMLACA